MLRIGLLLLVAVVAGCQRPTTSIVACPPIGLTADTERVVLRSSTDKRVELSFFDTMLKCKLHKKSGEIRPNYYLYGIARLLNPLEKGENAGVVEFSAYGALLNKSNEIAHRRIVPVRLKLKNEEITQFRVVYKRHDYTPQEEEKSFDYKVLGGFVLTPEQIAMNRRLTQARMRSPATPVNQ